MVKKYESCFLFKSEESDYRSALEEVKVHLSNHKATNVFFNNLIGEKALEYAIKKKDFRGRYEIIEFEMNPDNLKELEVQLKLVKNLLRYMILVKVNKKVNLKKIKKRGFKEQKDFNKEQKDFNKEQKDFNKEEDSLIRDKSELNESKER